MKNFKDFLKSVNYWLGFKYSKNKKALKYFNYVIYKKHLIYYIK